MKHLLLIASANGVWTPPEALIYTLLVIGAFLTAGVVLSIFTFYEDCYWGDESYRKLLKEGKNTSAKV